MPRILFVSNTANFSKFNRPIMQKLRSEGWIVDYASMGEESVLDCDNDYKINIARSPFSFKNFKGIKELRLLLENNKYDIIHCHTPMGGVIARAAARKLWKQKRVKIIYTAHGFHFYKGAPLLNWILYYPVEKWYSHFTDLLITIVPEDYEFAKKKMNCDVEMINGVGVNLERFIPLTLEQKSIIRAKNGFTDNDFIITIVAETNKNKNQIMLLREIKNLSKAIPNLKVLIIGKETLPIARNYVESQQLEQIVYFLGYRNDIPELTGMSSVAFSASIREGLPVNIIEAMACGVPIVASINRGHTALLKDGINGYLFPINSSKQMCGKLLAIYNDSVNAHKLGQAALDTSKKYDVYLVLKKMMEIYNNLMKVTI